jgi:hypothetical protein
MKTNQLKSKVGRAIMAFSLLLGIGIVLGSAAQAQNPDDRYAQERGRNWERYGNYGGSTELRQTALNAGYAEGINEGRLNRASGRYADLGNQSTYQRATKDYSSRLGDRELYRRYFREAFEDGYNNTERSGWDTSSRDKTRDREDRGKSNGLGRSRDDYGNFGGSFQLRQTALNAGFNEGTKQGRTDRSNRNSNGYQGRSTYQKATRDYSSGLGDREVYQRYFREAYEHGYADGYSGY